MGVDAGEGQGGGMPGARLRDHPRLRHVRAGLLELGLLTVVYAGYMATRLLADDNYLRAVRRAKELLRFENAVFLDWEQAIVRFFVEHDTLGLLASFHYATAHYIVTVVVLVWLWFRGRHVYLPARRTLAVATLIALALYLWLPTAPPRFLEGYADVLALHADTGWWGTDASAPKGLGHLTNELAAFPSLHAGWALWVALVIPRATGSRVLHGLGWTHAALTALVIVATGNHWMLDVIVGWFVVAVGLVVVAAYSPPVFATERVEAGVSTTETVA